MIGEGLNRDSYLRESLQGRMLEAGSGLEVLPASYGDGVRGLESEREREREREREKAQFVDGEREREREKKKKKKKKKKKLQK
jgi:hypothetical protein